MKTTSTNKSNIEKYKEELKILLNISEEELDKKFKSTLYSFKKNMEEINGDNFINSLMKLNYCEMVEYDKDEDSIHTIIDKHFIYDKNVNNNKDCFLCLCGKSHLKNLHLFNHSDLNGNQLIIGSSCIKQVCKLQDAYTENQILTQKLNQINGDVKLAEKMKVYKPCYKCQDLCINKNTNYKYEHMNNYCRDCLKGKLHNFIKCTRCDIKVIPASQPLPSYNNENNDKFKEICGKCWHQVNENEPWYKKKYNKKV